jgi:hypothetical protein
MAGGRKSSYKAEYADQAYKLCLLYNATVDKLADYFEVTTKTICVWQKDHPAFGEAIKRGREQTDFDVAKSLYHRAIGYSHPEEVFHMNARTGRVVRTKTTKHYPPDVTACIFWLKNRQQKSWRDRPLEENPGDEIPIPVKVVIDVQDGRVTSKVENDA